jgi:hypothetical protein
MAMTSKKQMAALGFCLVAIALYFGMRDLRYRGRVSELKAILTMYSIAQDASFGETGSYLAKTSELDAVKYPSSEVTVAFSSDELPKELASKIPADRMPFLSVKAYRILALRKLDDRYVVWTLDQTGAISPFPID